MSLIVVDTDVRLLYLQLALTGAALHRSLARVRTDSVLHVNCRNAHGRDFGTLGSAPAPSARTIHSRVRTGIRGQQPVYGLGEDSRRCAGGRPGTESAGRLDRC